LIMVLCSVFFAILLSKVDQSLPNAILANKWYIYNADPSAVHSILLNIAGTALGVVGVVFSITLVPLTIASSQYGPILLRSFLRDLPTQIVLGTYSATIAFCIFVAMGLPSNLNSDTIPLISVTFAILLFLISLAMLLYFFHHVADGLQASSIIARVGKEIEQEIRYESASSGPIDIPDKARIEYEKLRSTVMLEGQVVKATGSGYIRAVDFDELMKIAVKNNLIFYLKRIAGDFLVPGDMLLLAWPNPDEESSLIENINRAYMLGTNRTILQDVEFGMIQLVTIAVRALSPAINDPITPAMCLNRLGVSLSLLAENNLPSSYYIDNTQKLRVIVDPVSFDRLAGVSFNLIRQYGRSNADVLLSMLKTIATVAFHTHSDLDRKVLLQHAKLIQEDSFVALPSEYDKQRVRDGYNETLKAIENVDPDRQ
jgi:uncharacterized membrane protein